MATAANGSVACCTLMLREAEGIKVHGILKLCTGRSINGFGTTLGSVVHVKVSPVSDCRHGVMVTVVMLN